MDRNLRWIEATLEHRRGQRVPYNFSFSPPARRAVEQYYGTDDLENLLDFPIRMTGTVEKKPLYASPDDYGDTVTDAFGVVWSTSRIDRGAPVGPCLREDDLSSYVWPDPADERRFEGLDTWCEDTEGNFRVVWVGDLWERATFMRGMGEVLLDVALNPRFVDALLAGIAGYVLRTMEILFDRFEFECAALSDDYGTQKGMLMSPAHWRRFVKPRLAEIYAFARGRGRRVFHHTCGNVYPVIGDMIDIGLDVLHPVQPEAMDIHRLKREFGKDVTLCGGVGTQQLLPHGTPGQVQGEVKRLKSEMGGAGGYILEPGITLQADVPLENLVAMMEEAREAG